tara:strand:- start:1366 stop:1569 length:204 start_codon:yes stop_codon:yes gene_type:complete
MNILVKYVSMVNISKKEFLNKEKFLYDIANKDLNLRKTNNAFKKDFVYEKIFRLKPVYFITKNGYYD